MTTVAFGCSEHGEIVEAPLHAVVSCKCGRRAQPCRSGRQLSRPGEATARLMLFDTQRGEWVDLDALGLSCERAGRKREPWVSYGIPPKLNQAFQRTGQGPMFEPPDRVIPGPDGVSAYEILHHDDGSFSIPTLPPLSPETLIRHAERYGCDLVYWTAEQAGFFEEQLLRLGVALRTIAARHRKARRPETWWKDATPAKLPNVDAETILRLDAEGKTIGEIAALTGSTPKRTRAIVADAREGAAGPHG